MKFDIYYPVDGLNFMVSANVEFSKVATVEAADLKGLYIASQNDESAEFRKNGIRSSCVGDVFHNTEADTYHMVEGIGFRDLEGIRIKLEVS